jgi:P27 family predicted phage terminase small subunit
MGLRGPTPKATWLRKIEGNPSKRPLPENEPEPRIVAWLEPPADFSEEERKLWAAINRELSYLHILATCDRWLLERYTAILCKWREIKKQVDAYGGKLTYQVKGEDKVKRMRVLGPDGKPVMIDQLVEGKVKAFKPLPGYDKLIEYSTQLLRIEDRLGLSPASRSRITTSGEGGGSADGSDSGDDFEDL